MWAELCRLPHACLGAAWLRLRGSMLPTSTAEGGLWHRKMWCAYLYVGFSFLYNSMSIVRSQRTSGRKCFNVCVCVCVLALFICWLKESLRVWEPCTFTAITVSWNNTNLFSCLISFHLQYFTHINVHTHERYAHTHVCKPCQTFFPLYLEENGWDQKVKTHGKVWDKQHYKVIVITDPGRNRLS